MYMNRLIMVEKSRTIGIQFDDPFWLSKPNLRVKTPTTKKIVKEKIKKTSPGLLLVSFSLIFQPPILYLFGIIN